MATDNDGWVYPQSKQYQPYIVNFMEFFHGGVEYESNQEFTREQILEIQPLDVKRWLAMKAYNDPDYDVTRGDRPTHQRCESLAMAKKALSFFMVYKSVPWCNGQGNPTRSGVVNDVLKEVRKFEVRGEGADSNAKRPLRQIEFRKTMELFKRRPDFNHHYKYPMMGLWQYHLIGRVDDVSNFKTADPRGHSEFDFALKTRVRWSKNVLEERQCPPQIMLGALDPDFCCLLNFAIYLEEFLRYHPNAKYLFTENETENAPKNLISQYRGRLERVVWNDPEFIALEEEDDDDGIGTHSYQKFPSNYARQVGMSPDDIEIRGRWKTQGHRVVFRYIDVAQLSIDAKVAGSLCVGGPIKYKFKSCVTLSDDWLFEHVVPNIRRRYPNDSRLCRVLATALMFGALDEHLGEWLPPHCRDRITQAYLPLHPNTPQPVERIPLTIYQIEGTLCIDETPIHGAQQEANANHPNGATVAQVPLPHQAQREQMNAVLVNMQRMSQQQSQMHRQLEASIASMRQWASNQFKQINTNVRRFGGTITGGFARQDPQQANNRRQANNQQEIRDDGIHPATLSPTPRFVSELWDEYMFGIGNRKPAKDFSPQESGSTRNGIKQKYYRRKFVWLTIEKMIDRGESKDSAIHKIRQVYGYRSSVTKIIEGLIDDHKNGGTGDPNLINLRPFLRGGQHFQQSRGGGGGGRGTARSGRGGRGRGRGRGLFAPRGPATLQGNTQRIQALEEAGARVRADVGRELRPRDVVVPVVAAEEKEKEEAVTAEV